MSAHQTCEPPHGRERKHEAVQPAPAPATVREREEQLASAFAAVRSRAKTEEAGKRLPRG